MTQEPLTLSTILQDPLALLVLFLTFFAISSLLYDFFKEDH